MSQTKVMSGFRNVSGNTLRVIYDLESGVLFK